MADLIKLAEAMEIGIVKSRDGRIIQRESNPSFDPENDANDDYAVLQWAKTFHGTGKRTWFDFIEALDDILEDVWSYKIGDYARAALKVLNDG